VAWVAHLGGFITGLLTVSLFTPVKRPALAKVKANPGKSRAKKR
jgi:membrane associated rhomboid family serine protease